MYPAHFNLDESPFSITPDPRFVYLTQRHREALAHLLYGLGEGGGFVQLTGEVGTGKTTICRTLLRQLPEHLDVALIFNPQLSVPDLLQSICTELRIELPDEPLSIKALIDRLYAHLLDSNARGRRSVLIIDEAQNLSSEVLEEIRLLTNLETDDAKLLQVFLIGQPELRTKLERQDLRQLTQRITARYHLQPLDLDETRLYIRHRLSVAGCDHEIFTSAAMRKVHRLTGGIPRRINILCDRALLGAYSADELKVDASIVSRASGEIEDRQRAPVWRVARSASITIAAVAGLALGGLALRPDDLPVLDWIARASATLGRGAQGPSEQEQEQEPPQARPSETGPKEFVSAIVPLPDTDPAPRPEPEPSPPDPQLSAAPRLPPPPAEPALSVPPSTPPTPPPPPEPEIPRRLGLDEAIARVTADGRAEATRELARLWQLAPPPADDDLCGWAGTEGLTCHSRPATWAQLRDLDLPAVLELNTAQDRRIHALMVELSENEAALLLAGRAQRIAKTELERLWDGEQVLLWRAPFAVKPPIKLGEKGRRTRWLRETLDAIDGADPPTSGSEIFDSRLLERVKDFQRRRGLDADGIVGPQTLIHLTRQVPGNATPSISGTGAGTGGAGAGTDGSSPASAAMGTL